MNPESFALFDTAFGVCGLAWNERGLTRVQLPEADAAATRGRLEKRGAVETAPPPATADLIARLVRYFAGEEITFDDVAIALPESAGAAFARIYAETRRLRWGETARYGDIARRSHIANGARLVGQAMGANPIPIIIPCHRVLAAQDRTGGFSAYGGAATKERLLTLERVLLPL